jgi:mercuric ion binding protein
MKTKVGGLLTAMLLAGSLWAAGRKVEVTVNGMVCSFCAQGITKKFQARPEVASVKVALEDQKVYLDMKEGKDISDRDITTILKKSGYDVEKVDRKAP